jgi:hypothetical protein
MRFSGIVGRGAVVEAGGMHARVQPAVSDTVICAPAVRIGVIEMPPSSHGTAYADSMPRTARQGPSDRTIVVAYVYVASLGTNRRA